MLRVCKLHFNRGQRLPDFVVQLARDVAALLLLRGDQLRRQVLQFLRELDVLCHLPPEPPLQTSCIGDRQHGNGNADGKAKAQQLPELALHHPVAVGDLCLTLHVAGAVQRLNAFRYRNNRIAPRRHTKAQEIARLAEPSTAVRVEHFEHRFAIRADFLSQPRELIALDGNIGRRHIPAQHVVENGIGLLELLAVAVDVLRVAIEQRIAERHRCKQHLRADVGQRLLRSDVAGIDCAGPFLRGGDPLAELRPRENPQAEHQPETKKHDGSDAEPGFHL
jgi:hypothetical protein